MSEFNERDEGLINYAISLKNKEDYEESTIILKGLLNQYKYNSILHFLIAGNYYLTEDYENAKLFAKKAIHLSPKSEIASHILFLSLIGLCENDLAFEEMERFLSQNKANLYKTTIAEFYEGMGDEPFTLQQREMIIKYYLIYFEDQI